MSSPRHFTVEEILNMEGVVIRKIPATTTSRWRTINTAPLPSNAKVIEKQGGMMTYEQVKENALAGYAVTFDLSQGSQVRFSKHNSGFGPTIEAAYVDFLSKNAR
jgi:hypothetical protein